MKNLSSSKRRFIKIAYLFINFGDLSHIIIVFWIISILFKVPNENKDIREMSSIYCDFENRFDFQLSAFSFEESKSVISESY